MRRSAHAALLNRREALILAAAVSGGLLLDGCASNAQPALSGSTLATTWRDPVGNGQLRVAAGEPFVHRHELAPASAPGRQLALLGHLTDAHLMDAASPARVPFLARLGPPFQSTFRPQEALTAQVLAGAVAAVGALRPDFVIQGGDLTDNVQDNELQVALAILRGGRVSPGSGSHGYFGVQDASDPDPFYYRPEVDAPRHPGLLAAAVRPFHAGPGLPAPWLPVFGDHDALVQGEVVPDTLTGTLAIGERALWELPPGLAPPAGVVTQAAGSPDGPAFAPQLVSSFIEQALNGPTVRVPADPRRRELSVAEAVGRLRSAAGRVVASATDRLDYSVDVSDRLRLIVLDLASRVGGSGGVLVPGQLGFVSEAIAAAGGRWVVFVSHQTLRQTSGGEELAALLDRSPQVIATLAGHTHHNRIAPRRTPAGGRWEIETSSLIDWPQQARALRIRESGTGVVIETWMLDHVFPGPVGAIGQISRELSYLDAQGGRPGRFAGAPSDRNAVLYVSR